MSYPTTNFSAIFRVSLGHFDTFPFVICNNMPMQYTYPMTTRTSQELRYPLAFFSRIASPTCENILHPSLEVGQRLCRTGKGLVGAAQVQESIQKRKTLSFTRAARSSRIHL
jgi:hypothetical protein